jgi:CBS domain-containing protein
MKPWTVGDVMTTDVVSVTEDTPYRKIVDILAERRVSAVPVVDGFDRVVGVVSEADLLYKVEFSDEEEEKRVFHWPTRRAARAKAHGDVAKSLMTTPVVTVPPSTLVTVAAKLMDHEHVKRLPVVDDIGRLVGIVARSDLLKTYLRPDPQIRDEVVDDVLRRVLQLDPVAVEVDVVDGVVTLRGRVDRHTTAAIAVRLASAVRGVVEVRDELYWEFDDIAVSESGFYRSHPFSVSPSQPQ